MSKRTPTRIAEACGEWMAAIVMLALVVASCGLLVRITMWAAGR
jgi:hypothetical protein